MLQCTLSNRDAHLDESRLHFPGFFGLLPDLLLVFRLHFPDLLLVIGVQFSDLLLVIGVQFPKLPDKFDVLLRDFDGLLRDFDGLLLDLATELLNERAQIVEIFLVDRGHSEQE